MASLDSLHEVLRSNFIVTIVHKNLLIHYITRVVYAAITFFLFQLVFKFYLGMWTNGFVATNPFYCISFEPTFFSCEVCRVFWFELSLHLYSFVLLHYLPFGTMLMLLWEWIFSLLIFHPALKQKLTYIKITSQIKKGDGVKYLSFLDWSHL